MDAELLSIMVCPVSHAPLRLVGNWLYSTDRKTRRRYPVRDGIPIMLVGESEEVALEDFDRVMKNAEAQATTTNE
ncbi:MAG: Trm112 family protein [Phycisphaerae bacterium]